MIKHKLFALLLTTTFLTFSQAEKEVSLIDRLVVKRTEDRIEIGGGDGRKKVKDFRGEDVQFNMYIWRRHLI